MVPVKVAVVSVMAVAGPVVTAGAEGSARKAAPSADVAPIPERQAKATTRVNLAPELAMFFCGFRVRLRLEMLRNQRDEQLSVVICNQEKLDTVFKALEKFQFATALNSVNAMIEEYGILLIQMMGFT